MKGMPTFFILLILAALAYWGHSSGWQFPKPGAAMSGSSAEDDWCEEHGVPDSICVECHPEKFPPPSFFTACDLHHLVNCPLCHPEAAQVQGAVAVPKYDTQEAFRLMSRQENNPDCQLVRRRLQLASLETVDQLGLEFDVVEEQDMIESLEAPGEIIYDPASVVRLSSRVPGTIWEVFSRLGDHVGRGALLALIDAPGVATAKAELAEAVVQFAVARTRYTSLKESEGTFSRNTLLVAKADRDMALVRASLATQVLANLGLTPPENLSELEPDALMDTLRFLGIPEELAADLKKRTSTSGLYPLRASVSGNVIGTQLVKGENVGTSEELARIADLQNMLVRLVLPASSAAFVRLNQKIEFIPNTGTRALGGNISWISTTVDERTRTVEIRATLRESGEQLRAGVFGTGRIILREAPATLVVPRESVQWDGSCNVVFVRDKNFLTEDGPRIIHVRQVRPGTRDDTSIEILAGVRRGEVVASRGSDVLRAKLLSGNLGAG